MSNMLIMAAFECGTPVAFKIFVKTNYLSLHRTAKPNAAERRVSTR